MNLNFTIYLCIIKIIPYAESCQKIGFNDSIYCMYEKYWNVKFSDAIYTFTKYLPEHKFASANLSCL